MDVATVALFLALASVVVDRGCAFNLDTRFPIRFVGDDGQGESASFGTSVLLRTNRANASAAWMDISEPSPRKSDGSKLPGKVFRCPLRGGCKKIVFSPAPGNKNFEDFLGGAIAVQHLDRPGVMVTCASRWHNSTPHSGTYLFTGACNWNDPGLTDEWLTPLLNKEHVLSKGETPTVFNWAIGQAGFSAHFLAKDDHLPSVVLGAPGILNWRGGVVVCGKSGRQQQVTCNVPHLPADVITEFDYFGYQVTSGEFFTRGVRLVAVSAPRAGKAKEVMHGIVRVLRLPSNPGQNARLINSLVGDNVGSYFGASLATGDFNTDGFDDLVVGAPLSPGFGGLDGDIGAVHLYVRGSAKEEFKLSVKILGSKPGGRFGHSMACPGDLDKDGFTDLVVGAPHEDDGRGAVYVFNGGTDGLSPSYSQRISSVEFVPSIPRGFGISLSPGVDVDGNRYNDLAVGSYGAAFLLRAHPVVELSASLSATSNRVPQNATRVTFTACVNFKGVDTASEIDVLRTVEVRNRRELVSLQEPSVKILTSSIRLGARGLCDEMDVYIKNGSKYLEDFSVHLSARLDNNATRPAAVRVVNSTRPGEDGFCKECAVEKRVMDQTDMKMEFDNECRGDKCIADLALGWHFLRESTQSASHVVGSLKQLSLVVLVSNNGEPSYDTKLEVLWPARVTPANVPSNCEQIADKNRLDCKLGDLTADKNSVSVSVGLDMSRVLQLGPAASLDFVLVVKTRSEQKIANNTKVATLGLVRDDSLAIFGKAAGRASYRYAGGNMSTQQVNFAHEFSVEKIGESPVDDAVLTIRYPITWKLEGGDLATFLNAYEPEVTQDLQSLSCTSTEPFLDETTDSEGLDSRAKREVAPPATQGDAAKLPGNETFFLHCNTAGVFCGSIRCNARPMGVESTMRFTVRMRLEVAVMESLLGGKRIVSLTTEGEVAWDNHSKHVHGNATTHFIGATEVKGVASWIIALSIAGGLLLFFFVVMGLIKAGFFQRKQKKELEALIEQEEEVKAINRQSQMVQDLNSDID